MWEKKVVDSLWTSQRNSDLKSELVACSPFEDQQPRPRGTQNPVSEFKKEGYIEMWVETVLSYIGQSKVAGSTWVIGGDGRYYFEEAFQRVIKVLAAHKVKNIVVPKKGLLTTPAMSLLIRKEMALGGFLLTASHMAGGPDGFFGIKYSTCTGSPPSEELTAKIFSQGASLTGYRLVCDLYFPLDEGESYAYTIDGVYTTVMSCDATMLYANFVETIFDFEAIRKLLSGKGGLRNFSILIDCMNSCVAPFAIEVFEHRLGCKIGTVMNRERKGMFDCGYPSPSKSKALIQALRGGSWDAGFGLGYDGDRVMVMGRKGYSVSSGDSLAVIGAHLHCIPYFQLWGIKGFARTLPTSPGIDRVSKDLGFPLYEVPPRKKFFNRLIDAELISLYGDAFYGLEYSCMDESRTIAMLEAMETRVLLPSFLGQTLTAPPFEYVVQVAENFTYVCPITNEKADKVGAKIVFYCGSRIVGRGCNSRKNMFQIYLEHYTTDAGTFFQNDLAMVKPLSALAIKLTNIKKYAGETEPSIVAV